MPIGHINEHGQALRFEADFLTLPSDRLLERRIFLKLSLILVTKNCGHRCRCEDHHYEQPPKSCPNPEDGRRDGELLNFAFVLPKLLGRHSSTGCGISSKSFGDLRG